ncbi:terminase small subunit [Aurantimonas endophytica]|uniref:Phage terminase small subunit n=1 Tax=Aurantimonas endophytica TaxID=1522175 RepID=A0A7W6HGB1_9HYPH|nr:terminase small subunit [Aurantimonas endophytica]MBB4004467.1 phage terminase small subunit [Aurantimonas endophytica]MCO6405303.1 terminase small subunit [Aurantimonas endophytica]
MTLTAKQRRFVDEYLVDLNATQAAIRAGYSERTARQVASENLAKPDIAKAISDAKTERSARTRVDADWLLRRLADEAEADVGDLYDADGALLPVHQWPPIWRKGLVAGLDVEEIREEGVVVGLIRKVKLSDRIRRLELIGKHVEVQAFKDQVETSGNVTVNITGPDADL